MRSRRNGPQAINSALNGIVKNTIGQPARMSNRQSNYLTQTSQNVRQNTAQNNNSTNNQSNNTSNTVNKTKQPCAKKEHTVIDSLGNVFLLGMTVLISEVIDLTAAKALTYLLEPCLPEETIEELLDEQELAADIVSNIADLDLDFIPIAFE